MSEPLPIEGRTILNLNCYVNLEEMRLWEPSRIASFFDGLAKAIAASSEHDIKGHVDVKCEAGTND